MTIPKPPRMRVEFAPGADPGDRLTWFWEDITAYVRDADGVTIEQGRPDEGSQTDPSSCTLTLDNRDGRFSARNPLGPWYGKLGRNNPLRVRWVAELDQFARSVSNGWGETANGATWQLGGTGSNNTLDDWQVTNGQAVHRVDQVGTSRISYLPLAMFRDGDVYVTVDLPGVTDVTGGPLFFCVHTRFTNISADGYVCSLRVDPDETIWAEIERITNGTHTVLQQVQTEYTLSDGPFRIRVKTKSATTGIKIWPASEPEPRFFSAGILDYTHDGPGGIGLRAFVESTNTNTLPVTFEWSAFEVTNDRFVGYVSEWPTRWDTDARESTATIQANGLMRRLVQSQPLMSTLYRRISNQNALAYWPLEDGENAAFGANAVPGGSPLKTFGFDWGADQGPPGSSALPVIKAGSSFAGEVLPGPADRWHVEFVYFMEEAPNPNNILYVESLGTIRRWEINIQDMVLRLRGFDEDEDLIIDRTVQPVDFFGRYGRLALTAEDNSGILNWKLRWFPIGADGHFIDGTLAPATLGRVRRVLLPTRGPNASDITIGHLAVLPEFDSAAFNFADTGFDGELALSRLARLCGEENIDLHAIGIEFTASMNPQRTGDLMDQLRACETADDGVLWEMDGGLAYTPRASRYNQPAILHLDMDAGELAEPPEPTDDDQQIRNDVTASRDGGSSVRVVDAASVASVGTYDEEIDTNIGADGELRDYAGWRVHLGTVDEMRWPRINLDLGTNSHLIAPWLAVRIGNRATVTHGIPQLPGVPIDVLVDGWTEFISTAHYLVELNCVPASPWKVAVLDDPILGRLDTDGSELAAPADAPAQLNPNPGFETDTSGWFASGGSTTLVRTTDQAHSGVASALLTPDGVAATAEAGLMSPTAPVVVPGVQYTWSVWVMSPGGDNVTLALSWRASDGTLLFNESSAPFAVPAGVWTRLTFTSTAPAGAGRCSARVWLQGTPAASDLLYIDDAELLTGAVLSVATTHVPVWTIDPAEIPFDILVGGERMTVTQVTGTSSPQTFLVSRSVNGVAKAHDAGTPVRLAQPMTLAR